MTQDAGTDNNTMITGPDFRKIEKLRTSYKACLTSWDERHAFIVTCNREVPTWGYVPSADRGVHDFRVYAVLSTRGEDDAAEPWFGG